MTLRHVLSISSHPLHVLQCMLLLLIMRLERPLLKEKLIKVDIKGLQMPLPVLSCVISVTFPPLCLLFQYLR
jgi:hypothetical protein